MIKLNIRSEGKRAIFVYLNDLYVLYRANDTVRTIGLVDISPGLCKTHKNLIMATLFVYCKCDGKYRGIKHGRKSSFDKVNKILEGFKV